MKAGSKELDGMYNFSNKQTENIKAGSGGLGMAGQVPDGPGSQGEAMGPHMDGGIYKVDPVNEIKKRGVDLRQGGQLVPTRGDLTEEQNRDVVKKSLPKDIGSGKRRKMTDKDRAQMVNTGSLLGDAQAATNELERRNRDGKGPTMMYGSKKK